MNEFMRALDYEKLRCLVCNHVFGICENCPLSGLNQGCSPSSEYDIICDERIKIVKEYIERECLV